MKPDKKKNPLPYSGKPVYSREIPLACERSRPIIYPSLSLDLISWPLSAYMAKWEKKEARQIFRERKNLVKGHNGANSFQRGFYLLHLLTGDKLSRMAFFAFFSSKKCSCCCKKTCTFSPQKSYSPPAMFIFASTYWVASKGKWVVWVLRWETCVLSAEGGEMPPLALEQGGV